MSQAGIPVLSALELRALGVLVEKQLTTPDYYPLTLNALLAGCNQRTNRDPVINASEAEVLSALDGLKQHTLLIESYGASGRVMRYAHNLPKVLGIGDAMTALMTALMLRGPQTAGELRSSCDRLYRFVDISTVDGYLEDMASRAAGVLVRKLGKQAGSREHRWAQLLGGPVEDAAPPAAANGPAADADIAALRAEVESLREEVDELRARLDRLAGDSTQS